MPLLDAQRIEKRYPGVKALAGVDLGVDPGEVHALLGENGAGKSTLMKVIAGSVRPDAGRLLLDGDEVPFGDAEHSRTRGIGIVYQDLSLVPQRSVAENVVMGRWPRTRLGTVDWRRLRPEARRHLDRVGLAVDESRAVAELGMAERQQVELAKAPPVDRSQPGPRPAPHHHVLGDRALGHQAELLVDDPDAARAAVLGVPERHLLPVEQQPPGVRAHRPGDHLHQGRLPGSVLAEQGVHFAGVDAEVDPGECLDPRVALLDALGVEQRH